MEAQTARTKTIVIIFVIESNYQSLYVDGFLYSLLKLKAFIAFSEGSGPVTQKE